jgi:hypothetical protein
MVYHKIAFIILVLMLIVLVEDAGAKTYNVSYGGWNFSFALDTPIKPVLNTMAYKSNDTVGGLTVRNQVILKNYSTMKELAVIELYTYSNPVPITRYPYVSSVLEAMMRGKNFTNVSTKLYKIDGTDGIIGSGYNSSLRAREYWTYSLIWPSSDSTSKRAVGIMSWLGDNLSYQLFDTLHFKEANMWKMPLNQFINSSKTVSKGPVQLSTKENATLKRIDVNSDIF